MPEHNHIVMSIIFPLPLQPLKMEYHMCNTAAFLAACVQLGVPQDKVGLVQPCSYWTAAVDTNCACLVDCSCAQLETSRLTESLTC